MKASDFVRQTPRETEQNVREWMQECEMYNRIISRIYATAMPRTTVEVNPDGSLGRLVRTDLVLPDDAQATVNECRRAIREMGVARGLIQPTEE